MKVRDVMVKEVKFCSAETNLAAAIEILWKEGVGSLPVVENGLVLGIIDGLVRFSAGLEHPDDVVEDLLAALDAA